MVNMINIGISGTNDNRSTLQPQKSQGNAQFNNVNPFLTSTFSKAPNLLMSHTHRQPQSITGSSSGGQSKQKNVEELESMSAFIIR